MEVRGDGAASLDWVASYLDCVHERRDVRSECDDRGLDVLAKPLPEESELDFLVPEYLPTSDETW